MPRDRLLLLLLAVCITAAGKVQGQGPVDPYNPEYLPGVVLVKFADDLDLPVQGHGPAAKLAVLPGLDQVWRDNGIVQAERLFPQAARGPVRKIRAYDGTEHPVGSLHNIFRLTLSAGHDPKTVAARLAGQPGIDYAEPDPVFFTSERLAGGPAVKPRASAGYRAPAAPGPVSGQRAPMAKLTAAIPDDPLYGEQWYLGPFPGANAEAAWEATTGDSTQVIAIIDTGVDWDHPDLDDNIWANPDEISGNGMDDDENGFIDDVRGWDFVNHDNDPNDDNGHGTHVAGIAAAEGNNGIGITGVAPNARLMPLKVMQSSGRGSSSDVALAVVYAMQNGATVINMSLGSYGESLTLKHALENAYATSVLVAAAGNDGCKVDPPYPPMPKYAPMYPACYGFVFGVEATGQSAINEYRASFSNRDPSGPVTAANGFGHNYEIRAPGVGICSAFPNGLYRTLNGTSMAAPLVAGAVALMQVHRPTQSQEELWARLIQGSQSGILDVATSLDYPLVPELAYVSYTIDDTLPGGDRDGIPDAGEDLLIYLTVKNAGGRADSVWTRLRLAEFEDPSVATVIDSTSEIGTVSTYATLTGERSPFRVHVSGNVADDRDILFAYEIGASNAGATEGGTFVVTARNGVQLPAYRAGLTTLTADRNYIVTNNAVVESLDVRPGTTLRLGLGVSLLALQYMHCEGAPDSMITFTASTPGYWGRLIGPSGSERPAVVRYCIFEYATGGFGGENRGIVQNPALIEDCIFRNNTASGSGALLWFASDTVVACTFYGNKTTAVVLAPMGPFRANLVVGNRLQNSNGSPSTLAAVALSALDGEALGGLRDNVVYGNHRTSQTAVGPDKSYGLYGVHSFGVYHLPPAWYGTTNDVAIEGMIDDYYEDANNPIILGDSALSAPPRECHGVVWNVELNGHNPQDGYLDPIGVEDVRFDVHFNRPMDTSVTPFLTFGVREPYTQNMVIDDPAWSPDSTVWSATYQAGLETGDGVNTIRVADSRDNEHFEIPIENTRFKFTIQAAGSASNEFLATAGVGKIKLEWPGAPTDDALGYNLYRVITLTDSTFSDTSMINPALVADTTYTDFAVTPGTTYLYLYKIVGTDMAESDYSKAVAATPVGAAGGDANGDMAVNVLDIVAVVNFILEEFPQPFLLEAADANQDGEIDVLDVVRIVRTILGLPKASQASPSPGVAELALDHDSIVLRSTVPVAGLQFSLVGQGLPDLRLIPTSTLAGMEVGSVVRPDQATYLVYSLSRATLPTGESTLFTVQGRADLALTGVVLSDLDGRLVPTAVSAEELGGLPEAYSLAQNYPNPLNPSTTIRYGLPEAVPLRLSIYNLLGQEIRVLRQGPEEAGYHRVVWDGRDDRGRAVASGVYLYRLQAGRFIETRKLVVLK